MGTKFYILLMLFWIGCLNQSYADWYSEIGYRSPSTTSQDLDFIRKNLLQILKPLKLILVEESIDLSDQIFGILPSGAPVKILNPKYSIRLVSFQSKNSQQKINRGYLYLISAKDFTIDLNQTASAMKTVDKKIEFRLALIQEPDQSFFSLDLSPDSLHLKNEN